VIAGILLSAREKATRLPGKVLKPLGDGNVTQFLIRRLRQSRRAGFAGALQMPRTRSLRGRMPSSDSVMGTAALPNAMMSVLR